MRLPVVLRNLVVRTAVFGVLSALLAHGQENVSASAGPIGDQTVWRVFLKTAPPLKGADGKYQPAPYGSGVGSDPAPAGWAAPGFDDTQWAFRNTVFPAYGHQRGGGWELAVLYLRANSSVDDPAKAAGLGLEVRFRGGAVVYVNGREAGRAHLPEGELTPATLAQDYPREAFLTPDGSAPLPPSEMPAKELDERYRLRLRNLKVRIPAAWLKPGANTLALEIHRAAYREEPLKFHWHGVVGRTIWATAGFLGASLSEAPGVTAPKLPPFQIWNAPPMAMVGLEVKQGDPLVPLRPIVLSGPRNGVSSGQVVVTSLCIPHVLTGAVTALTSPDGAVIPASALQVRYGTLVEGEQPNPYDALLDESPRTKMPDDLGTMGGGPRPVDKTMLPLRSRPIWVTAHIPDVARPGVYTGTLTLSGLPQAVSVPVQLTVFDWRLPAPHDWKTWIALLQSPESVALQYKVPLWSDRHFELLAKSLDLLGQLGNRLAVVHVVPRSWLGREPMLVFQNTGVRYVPDFTFAGKYLKLYQKHVGEPSALVLQVWDVGVDDGRTKPKSVAIGERKGDQVVPATIPMFGEPGSEELWTAVLDGTRKLVKDLGWNERCLTLGTQQDSWPLPATMAFLKKVSGDMPWFIYSHGQGSPDLKRGFLINPDQGGPGGSNGWLHPRGYPNATNHRGSLVGGSYLPNYRQAGYSAVTGGFSGFGGHGFDYWATTDAEGRKGPAFTKYENGGNWYRIIRGACRTFVAPGPDGAVATVRYEMLREGLQESEAFIFVESALKDPKLPAALAAQVKALRPRLSAKIQAMLVAGTAVDSDWMAERDELYRCAAQVAKALGK